MKKYKIGVVGNGFVGNSIYHTFSPYYEVFVYDLNPKKSMSTHAEVMECDIIFVCVNTPMFEDGGIDLSMVESACQNISDAVGDDEKTREKFYTSRAIVLKSTVVPGTTEDLNATYGLPIIFSPEFLTERTAVADSLCANYVILGGMPEQTKIVERLYKDRFSDYYNVAIMDAREAEFVKYMRNCYFATKVTFMNEMYHMAEAMDIEWESALGGFKLDGRLGKSHLMVPGPDGKFGYGGHCFPKDINAMYNAAERFGYDAELLKTVEKMNLRFRDGAEWEDMEGRAVTKK